MRDSEVARRPIGLRAGAAAKVGSTGTSELGVQCRRGVTTRGLAALAIAAAACLLVSGCSPGADYPSIFPAVHDMPPPRADTPLDPDQVQQATEDLITERNHLSAEAQGAGQTQYAEAPAATR